MSSTAIATADSAELEDLFDSIALAPPVAGVGPVAALDEPGSAVEGGDSGDLEELFDKTAQSSPAVASSSAEAPSVPAKADPHDLPADAATKVINSVGHLTRQLHDTLAELGYDRTLQDAAAAALPDARQRIAYVVKLTEDAASRCLSAVEHATPLQENLAVDAQSLAGRWDTVCAGQSSVADFKALAQATREYLHEVTARTEQTRGHLREVMMAQEFQDLTGQVLKRISELANTLENQLIKLLVENAPGPVKPEAVGLLNGPAIDGSAPNVVASQAQVDELLESLGF